MAADVSALSTAASLWDAFAAQVDRTPEAIAVEDSNSSLTYADLAQRARRLASAVSGLAMPNMLVGVALPRSVDVIVAILAVHAAGCAYVPLDPAYPGARLAYMATDSGIGLLLSDSSQPPPWLPPGRPVLDVGLIRQLDLTGASPPVTDVPKLRQKQQLAYVIYTSGSTGMPKGVLVTHANVLTLLANSLGLLGVTNRDCWSMLHSYCFDFAVWEQWGALLTGARLVIPKAEVMQSPEDLCRFLQEQQVTVLNIVPFVFRHLISVYRRIPRKTPFRIVIFGGERLHSQSVAEFFALAETAPRIVNMYGITETTVHVTFKEIRENDLADKGSTPIGVPLQHLAVELLADDLTRVAEGTPGEIYVRGLGLADGYLGKPDLTAQRFPILTLPNTSPARYYRTGDMAFRDQHGDLHYIGRADDQIKIRGFRIEPGEIESNLRSHPIVSEAVVVAEVGSTGEEMLVAYIVPTGRDLVRKVLTRQLRSYLADRCPSYLIPNRFVAIDVLPVTLSGKIDRSALGQQNSTACSQESRKQN
jgi:amino acid adenylation domain-containing protein